MNPPLSDVQRINTTQSSKTLSSLLQDEGPLSPQMGKYSRERIFPSININETPTVSDTRVEADEPFAFTRAKSPPSLAPFAAATLLSTSEGSQDGSGEIREKRLRSVRILF